MILSKTIDGGKNTKGGIYVTKADKKIYLIKQKLIGILFLIITIAIIFIAKSGTTIVDQDATFALLTGPIGLYLIFTNKLFMCD